eukprot:m.156439 g.156439  ORF g.156439 m.156439 type:complete len:767 (+) comp15152_c0_seq6:852-3152(+)
MHDTIRLPWLPPTLATDGLTDPVSVVGFINAPSFLVDSTAIINRIVACDAFDEVASLPDEVLIQVHHAKEEQVCHVLLCSPLDLHTLAAGVAAAKNQPEAAESTLVQLQQSYLRALLLLFSVCHVVTLLLPTPSLPLHFIRLFISLEDLRTPYLAHVAACPTDPHLVQLEDRSEAKTGLSWLTPAFVPGQSTVRHETTPLSTLAATLASLPLPSRPGRFIPHLLMLFPDHVGLTPDETAKLQQALETQVRRVLHQACVHSVGADAHPSQFFTLPQRFAFLFNPRAGISSSSDVISLLYSTTPSSHVPTSDLAPLQAQLKTLTARPSIAFGPWLLGTCILFQTLLSGPKGPTVPQTKQQAHLHTALTRTLDPLAAHAAARAAAVFPAAVAAYRANLPPRYGAEHHQRTVQAAVELLIASLRGLPSEAHVTQLRAECDRIWRDGRQQCEARSVTGAPCTLAAHDDSVAHTSGSTAVATCVCGRSQLEVSEPFDFAAAAIFPESDCCKSHIKSSRVLVLAAAEPLSAGEAMSGARESEGEAEQTLESMAGLDLTGSAPAAPSMLLAMLGRSADYSPAAGMPGKQFFASGANQLLSWEVTVPLSRLDRATTTAAGSSERGASVWAAGRGKLLFREGHDHVTLPALLGLEYECCHGHRTIAAAPRAVAQLGPSGLVKQHAAPLLQNDMPLFQPCCSTTAQARRVHVVTPDAADITLAPIFTVDGVALHSAPHTLPRASLCSLLLPRYFYHKGSLLDPSTGFLHKNFLTVPS